MSFGPFPVAGGWGKGLSRLRSRPATGSAPALLCPRQYGK
jgi:hypothetical protein